MSIKKYQKMSQERLNELLINACIYHDINIIKVLLLAEDLPKHAEINHINSYGNSPLVSACYSGSLEIVQFLLETPELKELADIYNPHYKGKNILICSCIKEHYDIAKYLIFDMNIKVGKETIAWLKGNNYLKKDFSNIIEMIETRELNKKLNQNLENKSKLKRNKL